MKSYRIAALTLALAAAACGSKYEGGIQCPAALRGRVMCIPNDGKYDLLRCEEEFWGENSFLMPVSSRQDAIAGFDRLDYCKTTCKSYGNDCFIPEPTPTPTPAPEQEVITVNPDGTVDIDVGAIDLSKMPEVKK